MTTLSINQDLTAKNRLRLIVLNGKRFTDLALILECDILWSGLLPVPYRVSSTRMSLQGRANDTNMIFKYLTATGVLLLWW